MDGPPLSFLLVLFAFLVSSGRAYDTFYLESECANGSAVLALSESGSGSAYLVRATQRSSYSLQLSCKLSVTAPPGHHVTLSVRQIDFKTRWDGACEDYVKIRNLNYCQKLYREDEERHFDSTDDKPSNAIDVFYHTSGDNATLSGFAGLQFTVTAFRIGVGGNDSFECSNGHLVWAALTCDGHNNCGDMSDEDTYGPADCGGGGRGPSVLIVLALLIVFLLIVMCVATLLCSKNERVTRIRARTLSYMRGKRNSSS